MMDPVDQFGAWFAEAKAHPAVIEPTAMCVATVGDNGQPSARIVLLKHFDTRGFVFYTNLESRKSCQIYANPHVALCMHWAALERQIRVEGIAEPVSREEADAYYASRARQSRIGAWASRQSQPLASPEALQQAVADATERFEGKEIPRPEFWSGWRIVPTLIELWQQGDFRLHDRRVYARAGDGWDMTRLYP